jgi:hypothetical protein
MKLTTVSGGEVISVKDLKTGEIVPQVIEVQSEEDIGPVTQETEAHV